MSCASGIELSGDKNGAESHVFLPPVLRNRLLVARGYEFLPAVLRNRLLVARHGAGAKKCLGPAPLQIINFLNIKCLRFSGGASPHKKSAPAPSRNLACSKSFFGLAQNSEKHASCACPVSYCLPATYNFFPKALQVGKIMEVIEY